MSTGLECEILKTGGEWFYVLQSWDCPVGAWDWMEYATAYGPHATEDAALKHLSDNHANPGGHSTYDYDAAGRTPEGSLAALLADAKNTRSRDSGVWWIGR
jgi:hypothetical protein